MKPTLLFYLFKKLFIFFILLSFTVATYAQKKQKEKTMFGLGAFYNFQTEGVAIDLRARIPVYKNTYVVPRLSYFPGINNIHEFYLGADVNYQFLKYKKLRPYALLGGFYDNWINSSDFISSKAKKNNFVLEGGAGVMFNLGCLNPFIEYRYDTKWKEGSLGAGVYFKFGECFGKKRQKIRCPAFS